MFPTFSPPPLFSIIFLTVLYLSSPLRKMSPSYVSSQNVRMFEEGPDDAKTSSLFPPPFLGDFFIALSTDNRPWKTFFSFLLFSPGVHCSLCPRSLPFPEIFSFSGCPPHTHSPCPTGKHPRLLGRFVAKQLGFRVDLFFYSSFP